MVAGDGSHALGLSQPTLQFFSVALFIHGDTPSRLDERAAQWFTFLSATFWGKTQFHPVNVKRVPIVQACSPKKPATKRTTTMTPMM
jgi:hypothetical protein